MFNDWVWNIHLESGKRLARKNIDFSRKSFLDFVKFMCSVTSQSFSLIVSNFHCFGHERQCIAR